MVAFDIHEEPLQFLQFLVGLMFTSSDLIGYDPTIQTSPGCSMTVTIDNTYTIKDILSTSAMIRGRATICWHAEVFNQQKKFPEQKVRVWRPVESKVLIML